MFGAAAAAGASVLGSAASMYSAHQRNKAAARQAKLNREFQKKEAKKQRRFQKKMSNTAHQRQVKDMRKAGLNPVLSVTGGGGASSPPGASGSGAQADVVAEDPELQNVVSSALQAKALEQTIKNQKADVNVKKEQKQLLKDQQSKTKAEAKKTRAEAKISEGEVPIAEAKESFFSDLFDQFSDTSSKEIQKKQKFRKPVKNKKLPSKKPPKRFIEKNPNTKPSRRQRGAM